VSYFEATATALPGTRTRISEDAGVNVRAIFAQAAKEGGSGIASRALNFVYITVIVVHEVRPLALSARGWPDPWRRGPVRARRPRRELRRKFFGPLAA
jgi:hypothetical protein